MKSWAIFAGALIVGASLLSTDVAAAPAATATEPLGLQYAKASNCFACHAEAHKVVGPAFDAVAKRYAGQEPAIVNKLAEKVIKGGSGNWGTVAMTPHPDLGTDKARTIVEWVLSLKPGTGAVASTAPAKTYTYKTADGKSVTLDFPLYVAGQAPKVTKGVFSGYEQFNSTCNRCHGDDAVGGAYAAPDLRLALQGGMTYQQFLDTALAGRVSKGMPSWAGFYSPAEIKEIYEYVKGRSLGLVPQGTPPSAQD